MVFYLIILVVEMDCSLGLADEGSDEELLNAATVVV